MKMQLASLKPLQVPKLSLLMNRQGEGLRTQTLYRKASQLLETAYHMSATMKVVDLKQTKSGRSHTNIPWLKHLGSRGSWAAVSRRELGPCSVSNLRIFPLPRGGTSTFPSSQHPEQGLLQSRAPAYPFRPTCQRSALVAAIPACSS